MKNVTIPIDEYNRLVEAKKLLDSLQQYFNSTPTEQYAVIPGKKDIRDMTVKERNAYIKSLDFSSKRLKRKND